MTIYCRAHVQFEGVDLGKLHDHIEKDHAEDFKNISTGEEYTQICRKLFAEEIFEIHGPNRLSDTAWIKQSWGRVPKLGVNVADNDRAKR
jgi:hypothetical protein